MPQLDEIDIFSRDHMTVDKFDPQGNLIDRKIIFSTSQKGDPLVSGAREEFDALNAPSTFNFSQENPVRMVDPVGGSVVEVPPDFEVVQSYMNAGYQLEMPTLGGMGGPATRKRRARRGKSPYKKPGRRKGFVSKGSVSDKEYESFRDSLKNQDIFEYNKYSLGGSVSEMMGRTGPDLTAAQIANLAGAFADPYGGADLTGNYPEFPARGVSVEEMLRGPRAPSFLENLRQGNFGSAVLQGIGAIPVLGGMSKMIRGASRAGRTPPDPRMLRAAEQGFDVDNIYYHGTGAFNPDNPALSGEPISEFLLPSRDRGQTKTAGTGVFFSSSPRVAETYTKQREVMYPVYLNKKEYLKIKPSSKGQLWSNIEVDDLVVEYPDGTTRMAVDVFDDLDPKTMTDTDQLSFLARQAGHKGLIIEGVRDIGMTQVGRYRDMANYLKSRGYDSRLPTSGSEEDYLINKKIPEEVLRDAKKYADDLMEQDSDIVVSFDPSTVRSVNAQFLDDPDSPPLLRSEGGEVDIFDVDSYSLGGSVGDMIREQAGIRREDVLTPAQLANIAGGFVDPLGATDTFGLYPEFPTDRSVTIKDMASSDYPRSPSAAENLARGDYLNLGIQSLGFVPILGGIARTIRAMGKMPPSIVDPLSTDASGLLTGRTGFGPEAELAQAKDTPPQLARIIDDESVLQKQYAKDLTVPELAKLANKKSAASFLNFMETFPAAREMATVAQAGLAKKGWYRQSAQALYDVFGDEAPRFAALLAATSPQTSVQGNLLNATSIWRNLTQNNMPRDPVLFDIINEPGVAAALKLKKNVPLKNADGSPQLNKAGNQKYGLRNISEQEAREVIKKAGGGDSTFDIGRMQIEIMGDAVQGEKGAESVLDAWVSNSIRAINVPDDEMDKLVLSGPKVDSFMRNLVNNTVEVTNDTWMANYLGVEQNVFGGSLNPARIDPGKGPGYLAANALTRNASRILSDRIGENVTPEMIQEMVWSWSKAVFEQSRAVGMSPREFIQKGRLTDAMINDVPDFSSLLRDPDLPYRNILEASGATVGQFKKGEIPKGNRTEEIMRSSETARRNLERAANRLKFIKADQLALGAIVPLVAINIVNMGKVPDEEEGSSEVDNIDIFN